MNTIYMPLGPDYSFYGSHEVDRHIYIHVRHIYTHIHPTTTTTRGYFCIRDQTYFPVKGLNRTIQLFKELCVLFSEIT